MTNYKGKLQEYFQKKGISISELKYQIIDQKYQSEGNKNWFQFQIELPGYPVIKGDMKTTKKQAEQSAAQNFIEQTQIFQIAINDLKIDNSKKSEDFNLENKKEKYLPPMDYNSIILIDIENRPKLVRLSWKNDSLRIGIVSKYSDHADLHQELEQFCQLKVINSDAANAADYGIIFEAGYLLSTLQNHPDLSKKKINWVIVSGDKFAGSVERMLQEAGYSCSVAKTRMHLEEYLQ